MREKRILSQKKGIKMKSLKSLVVVVALLLAACGSDDSGSWYTGHWLYEDDDVGVGLQLNEDGTYVAQILILTSANSAYDQIEGGRYTVNGNTLTLTPERSTCTVQDDPEAFKVSSVQITRSGPQLLVVFEEGDIVSFGRLPSTPAPANLVITTGCFLDGGDFVKRPIRGP
jgi:hypothetical protein